MVLSMGLRDDIDNSVKDFERRVAQWEPKLQEIGRDHLLRRGVRGASSGRAGWEKKPTPQSDGVYLVEMTHPDLRPGITLVVTVVFDHRGLWEPLVSKVVIREGSRRVRGRMNDLKDLEPFLA